MAREKPTPIKKPNGVPSSKDPSVQRLYVELERIRTESLSQEACPIQESRDKLVVLSHRHSELGELVAQFLLQEGLLPQTR